VPMLQMFAVTWLGQSKSSPTVASAKLKQRKSSLMLTRKLQVLNPGNPLFCVCEVCSAPFISPAQQPEEAEREVEAKFDAHECSPDEDSPNGSEE
jgi:hypothetical protein